MSALFLFEDEANVTKDAGTDASLNVIYHKTWFFILFVQKNELFSDCWLDNFDGKLWMNPDDPREDYINCTVHLYLFKELVLFHNPLFNWYAMDACQKVYGIKYMNVVMF